MFEFFIALCGGLYWACKLSGDKRAVRNAQRRGREISETYQQRRRRMVSHAVDNNLEASMASKVVGRAQMDEDFAGLGVDTSVLPTKEVRTLYTDLLLARAGKLREQYLDARNILVDTNIAVCGPAYGDAQRARRNAWVECLLAIEKELLRHGVDPFFLWVVPGWQASGAPTETVTRLRDVGDGRYGNGRLQTLYSTYYDERLCSMCSP